MKWRVRKYAGTDKYTKGWVAWPSVNEEFSGIVFATWREALDYASSPMVRVNSRLAALERRLFG